MFSELKTDVVCNHIMALCYLLQVSTFIEQVVEDESQMEGLPLDCSKVMVWQLRIEPTAQYSYPPQWLMKNNLDAIFPHISKV